MQQAQPPEGLGLFNLPSKWVGVAGQLSWVTTGDENERHLGHRSLKESK